MVYLKTFEAFTNNLPKAVDIENEKTLMDKSLDSELTEEEKEELAKEEEEDKVEDKSK